VTLAVRHLPPSTDGEASANSIGSRDVETLQTLWKIKHGRRRKDGRRLASREPYAAFAKT